MALRRKNPDFEHMNSTRARAPVFFLVPHFFPRYVLQYSVLLQYNTVLDAQMVFRSIENWSLERGLIFSKEE